MRTNEIHDAIKYAWNIRTVRPTAENRFTWYYMAMHSYTKTIRYRIHSLYIAYMAFLHDYGTLSSQNNCWKWCWICKITCVTFCPMERHGDGDGMRAPFHLFVRDYYYYYSKFDTKTAFAIKQGKNDRFAERRMCLSFGWCWQSVSQRYVVCI